MRRVVSELTNVVTAAVTQQLEEQSTSADSIDAVALRLRTREQVVNECSKGLRRSVLVGIREHDSGAGRNVRRYTRQASIVSCSTNHDE